MSNISPPLHLALPKTTRNNLLEIAVFSQIMLKDKLEYVMVGIQKRQDGHNWKSLGSLCLLDSNNNNIEWRSIEIERGRLVPFTYISNVFSPRQVLSTMAFVHLHHWSVDAFSTGDIGCTLQERRGGGTAEYREKAREREGERGEKERDTEGGGRVAEHDWRTSFEDEEGLVWDCQRWNMLLDLVGCPQDNTCRTWDELSPISSKRVEEEVWLRIEKEKGWKDRDVHQKFL